MISDIEEALDRIISWFKSQDMPLIELLEPGLSTASIKAQSNSLPIQLPEDLIRIYLWRNGTTLSQEHNLNSHYFQPGYYLLSLKNAMHYYQIYRAGANWDPFWFPILASGGGDFYVVVCGSDVRENGQILNFIRGENDTPRIYLNIKTMIFTIAECYDSGAYFLDEFGFLKINYKLEAEIAQELNPGVEEWQVQF